MAGYATVGGGFKARGGLELHRGCVYAADYVCCEVSEGCLYIVGTLSLRLVGQKRFAGHG